MSSLTSSYRPRSQLQTIEIHDEEAIEHLERGRKRRRSSGGSPPMHISSNGSTNLRGRGRRRSVSQSESQSRIDENTKPASLGRKSPGRKYQKKFLEVEIEKEHKRRSQSPSRSRSRGRKGETKPRRRQRTRTRSRSHGVVKESLVEADEDNEVAVEDE